MGRQDGHLRTTFFLAFFLCLGWLILSRSASTASAHANLARAEPAPNAVLETAPEQVTIWFTEPLEPQFSQIQVLDGAGRPVDLGDSWLNAADPTQLAVTLQPLVEGTYTVAWTNVSTVDGHKVRGSYVFSVGQPISGTAQLSVAQQPLLQSPLEPVLRWLTLLSMMAIVGGFAFQFWVMRPALQEIGRGKSFRELKQSLARRSVRLNWLALAMFLAASIAHLLLQATISAELPFFQTFGQPLATLITTTSWGRLWLVRMALTLILGVLLWLAYRQGNRTRREQLNPFEVAAFITGLAILLTLSLTSHAAATLEIRAPALFNDYLHLLAAAVWVGALFHFAPALPLIWAGLKPEPRRRLLATLVPRFSVLGIASVFVLVVSGFFNAWAQVTSPAALTTPYGRILLVKTGLVLLILALAAINLLQVRPRLAREEEAAAQLRKLVFGEAGLAVLVVLLVGLLTALEPARQVASRQGLGQESGLSLEDSNEDTTIALTIVPGQVGLNQMVVTLTDQRGQPIDNADDVSIRPTYLQTDLGEAAVSAANLGNGQYKVDEIMLGLAGPWQAGLTVRRPDAFDARAAFRFELGQAQSGSSTTIAPEARMGQRLWATELILLGGILIGIGLLFGRRQKIKGAGIAVPGLFALGMAFVLFIRLPTEQPVVTEPVQTEIVGNPFLPDEISLKAGQKVYEDHCMICHGLTGHGDGPRSAGADTVDIIEHVPLHADIEYFEITEAHESRGDLNYSKSEISDDDIWNLVNYLHAFEADQLLAEEYFRQARNLAEQGDIGEALTMLNQVIELSPRFVQALQGRGIISIDQGNLEQAVADQSRIIELDPTYADGYYYRAEAFRLAGELEKATEDYSQAIALDTNHSEALYARGVIQANRGQTQKAIEDLQRFLQLEVQSDDRAAIEELIAQLEGQATPPAIQPAEAVTLDLSSLPAGFEQLPPASLGLVEGRPIEIGTTVARSFAFGNSSEFELIWGYSTPLPSSQDQAAFNSQLNPDALLRFLSSGLRIGEVIESSPLSPPAELGDDAAGLSARFSDQDQQTQIDGLAFRQGEVGVLLFAAYRTDQVSSVSLDNLARLLAEAVGH